MRFGGCFCLRLIYCFASHICLRKAGQHRKICCSVEQETRDAKRGAWSGTFDIPFVQKGGGTGRKKVTDVSCTPPTAPGEAVAQRSAPPETAKSTASPDAKDVKVPRWVEVLSALLAPAIALLAAVIAWAQWRTARDRVKLDLFDRRMAAYERLRGAVVPINASGRVKNADTDSFARAITK
jgi:hypothetical protein